MPPAIKAHRRPAAVSAVHRGTRRGAAYVPPREAGYDSRWERFRAEFLLRNPICGYCLNLTGRVVEARVVDHIVPHGGDPDLFWPDGPEDQNFMACCTTCHVGMKARAERFAERHGKDIRRLLVSWGALDMQTSDPMDFPSGHAVPLPAGSLLVYGPPASGKTTAARAMPGTVYDVDDMAVGLGLPRYGRTMDQARQAVAERNAALMQHTAGPAVIVATCVNPWEVLRWQRATGCQSISMTTTESECLRRVQADPARFAALPLQMRLIRRWFAARP